MGFEMRGTCEMRIGEERMRDRIAFDFVDTTSSNPTPAQWATSSKELLPLSHRYTEGSED
jgi:hypothetical protein